MSVINNLQKKDIELLSIFYLKNNITLSPDNITDSYKIQYNVLYKNILKNKDIFENLYTYISKSKYINRFANNDDLRHIIFMSMVYSIITTTSSFKNTNLPVTKYDLYNLFCKILKNYTLIYKDHSPKLLTEQFGIYSCILNYLHESKYIAVTYIYNKGKKLINYNFIGLTVENFINLRYTAEPAVVYESAGIHYYVQHTVFSIETVIKQNIYNSAKIDIDTSTTTQLNKIPLYIDYNLLQILKEINIYAYTDESSLTAAIIKLNSEYLSIITKLKNNSPWLQSTLPSDMHPSEDNIQNEFQNCDIIDTKTAGNDLNLNYIIVSNTLANKAALKQDYFKTYQQNLTLLYDNYKFLKIIEFAQNIKDTPYYLAHFQDFRGRMYSYSILSPTNTKFMRYIIKYTKISEAEILALELQITETIAYKILSPYFYMLDFLKIYNPTKLLQQNLLYSFIELGKLRKAKLLNLDKKYIHISEFIIKGIEIYKTQVNTFDDFYDILYHRKLLYHINTLLKTKNIENYIILKDSSGSVLQHLNTWLNPANPKTLKYFNISSHDTWYDPYTVIISDFFKKKGKLLYPIYDNALSRSKLKKTIMTKLYNISYLNAMKDYLDQFNPKPANLDYLNIKSNFKIFWEYLQTDLDSFFQKTIESFKNLPYEQIINADKYNYGYNILELKRHDIQIEGKRSTILLANPTNKIDNKTTRRAITPNIMHTTDAIYAKYIINKLNIYTIHDEFLIPITHLSYALDQMNYIYSIYIINTNVDRSKCDVVYSFFITL